MKQITLILLIAIIVDGVILLIQEIYVPQKENNYEYSPTDFIKQKFH